MNYQKEENNKKIEKKVTIKRNKKTEIIKTNKIKSKIKIKNSDKKRKNSNEDVIYDFKIKKIQKRIDYTNGNGNSTTINNISFDNIEKYNYILNIQNNNKQNYKNIILKNFTLNI